jgi:hypothetical protein
MYGPMYVPLALVKDGENRRGTRLLRSCALVRVWPAAAMPKIKSVQHGS